MDQRLLGIYLSRILSGFYIFVYGNQRYKLVYPDIHIKYEAEIYSQNEYEENKFNDWITEDAIVDTLVALGLWSYSGDDNLKNIEKQIDELKIDLYKNFLNPSKTKTIKKTLANIKAQYNRLYNIRHSLDQYTPEGYSQLLKNNFILVYSLYDSNNNRVFQNLESVDSTLLENISYTISLNTLDISTFKSIARSDMWKNYWSANNTNLFDKSTVNWTDEQKTLVVLTKMYDSAHDHPECPPDKVFEDDDSFDGWMLLQKQENEKNRNKNRTEKALNGKGLDKAGEVFVIANSQEEAQNIYDLNDTNGRHTIKERDNVIFRSGGHIEDQHLPDVQRNLMIQTNEQYKNRK